MASHTSLTHDDEEGETSTSFCPYCNINLAYPAGSQLIQCPQCNNTLDPNSAHQIRCTGCSTLLAYPAQSKYIQCPKCLFTMDPREVGPLGAAGSAVPPAPHSTAHSGGGGGGGGAPASTEPKKRRDPNAPKAVCNAYMIFCKSRRGELKNELPELAFGKIGAKLGEMWRNMTSEEKKPYEDRAMVDRERYRKEMIEYTAGRGEHAGAAHKRAKHEPEANEDDQKLARDVSQQQAKAAQRARRESAQRQQHRDEDEDEEEDASGRSYSDREEGEED